MYQAAELEQQAAQQEHAEQERAYAAQAATEKTAAEKRKWAKRKEEEDKRWRDSAPRLTTAQLQLYAAPDPAAACCVCGQAECTIRYAKAATRAVHRQQLGPAAAMLRSHCGHGQSCCCCCCCCVRRCATCQPASGFVMLCAACDKGLHRNVHMHRRQEYSRNCWKDLPLADADEGKCMLSWSADPQQMPCSQQCAHARSCQAACMQPRSVRPASPFVQDTSWSSPLSVTSAAAATSRTLWSRHRHWTTSHWVRWTQP